MKKIMKNILQIICFLITTISFCISYALAQEDQVQPPDLGLKCVTKAKGYTVHFTAYQQQREVAEDDKEARKRFEPYCREIPEPGLTYITLDLVDRYTRHQPVAVRIVEAVAAKKREIEEVRTLLEIPAKKYRTGMLELKVDFDTPALYAVILTIGGEELKVPVRVGIEKQVPLIRRALPIIFGVLVLAAIGYAIYRFRPLQGPKVKETEGKKEEEREEKDETENKDKND